ncbi:MAG: AIPR family protein [Desulfurivibrio sp.]|nr:AIPR family protein [Desulfurivibrio sp.]
MSEIESFYQDFRQEVLARADANEDFIESEFVEYLTEFLVDSGEIESFDYCHYRADKGIRVDGYNLIEEDGILNLFISDYRNKDELTSLTKTEIEKAFKRLENFFSNSLKQNFYSQLEETSPGYGLAYEIYTRRNELSKIRLFLLSNGLLSSRIQSLESKSYIGYDFSYNVWDVSRLHRLLSSRKGKEDIVINIVETFGSSLPCLPAHLDTEAYQSYLMVMPGNMLAHLYEQYGARLLEQNVRCFLQFRGNVNKGIRNTIMNEPEMFFAYNNGITATAESVEIDQSNGATRISQLTNFQIVNGGQTTASIFSARRKDKKDLSKIFVQVKLSIVDSERSIDVVPRISEYANSQNKVNAADFFANHPFHIRIEKFSRRIWAPNKEGQLRQTKWFYERARGQYLDAQAHFTPSERKKFKVEFPKDQMFTKTDLAKFENAWEDCPHIVSKGAQKNFALFASEIGKRWEKDETQFNELYFKHLVAKTIIFRTLEKLIMKQTWYGGGYRAQIIAYTIAWLGRKISEIKLTVDFSRIWDEQQISDIFYRELERVSYRIHQIITDTPENVSNVTEWCKREGCWLMVKNFNMDLGAEFIKELKGIDEVKEDKKDAKKVQRIDDGITCQKKVIALGVEKWKEAAEFGLTNNLLNKKDMGILATAAAMPERIPSEKQCIYLINLLKRLELEGLKLQDG